MRHACRYCLRNVIQRVNAFGKRFERQMPLIATVQQALDLRRIAQNVAFADQHAMTIANAVERCLRILDTGDMYQPGQPGNSSTSPARW